MTKAKKLSIVSALAATTALAGAAHADSTLLFTGASVTDDSYYAYVGGVTAVDGDLSKDGMLIRATGAFGGYEYDRPGTTDVDGDILAGDIMIGYQTYLGAGEGIRGGRFTVYLGGDYQDHDLSPNDTANPVNGSEAGLKGQAEIMLDLAHDTVFSVIGSYSTAYESYWSRIRVGYDVGDVVIGPEVSLMGSESYDQQRFGVFLDEFAISDSVNGGLSLGYSNASRRGDNSIYGEIRLSTTF